MKLVCELIVGIKAVRRAAVPVLLVVASGSGSGGRGGGGGFLSW